MTENRLTVPELAALAGIAHGFFTRVGGVSHGVYESLNGGPGSNDDAMAVDENRRRIRASLGAKHLISLHQCHSADVIRVDGPFAGARPKADAMVTDRPGLALGVLTADCGPLLLADAEARIAGAAHAGWRGALDGVIEATVEAMCALGARRERIVGALGPTLGPLSYEVGPEFEARFLAADEANGRFFRRAEGAERPRFDLPGYIAHRVERSGIGTFVDLARDTYAEPELFFSYRRAVHRSEQDYGRLVAAIVLGG